MRLNTASGMRSHVTEEERGEMESFSRFQYRKRYEITCDMNGNSLSMTILLVSIPQAV